MRNDFELSMLSRMSGEIELGIYPSNSEDLRDSVRAFIFRLRPFFRLEYTRKMALLLRKDLDLVMSSMLYSAAIMRNIEEPGWSVRHVEMATGLSPETSELILKVMERYSSTGDVLRRILESIEVEKTDGMPFPDKQEKLIRSYKLRLHSLDAEHKNLHKVWDENNMLIEDTRRRMRFSSKDGIISILWLKERR